MPSLAAKLWILLHQPAEFFPVFGDGSPVVFVVYPLVPWIGVIAVGYAFGAIYTLDPARRRTLLLRTGLGLIAAFIVIRATNLYGDPRPWSPQAACCSRCFPFVNRRVSVSLMYLLMTIGPALLALAWFESPALSERGESRRAAITSRADHTRVGRVPMFFYLWQWPLAHGLAVAVSAGAGKDIGWYARAHPRCSRRCRPTPASICRSYLAGSGSLSIAQLWFSRVKNGTPPAVQIPVNSQSRAKAGTSGRHFAAANPCGGQADSIA